jgi:hypothetical protein
MNKLIDVTIRADMAFTINCKAEKWIEKVPSGSGTVDLPMQEVDDDSAIEDLANQLGQMGLAAAHCKEAAEILWNHCMTDYEYEE